MGVTSIINGGIPKPFLIGWAAKVTAETAVDKHSLVGKMIEDDGERAAIDYLKASRYRTSGQAADRGTVVHSAVDAYLSGKGIDEAHVKEQLDEARVPKTLHKGALGMVKAACNFLDEHVVDVLHNEATVYSRKHGYAGTADIIATMHVGGSVQPVIIDFKTSKAIYDETSLQLCAYANADFVGGNDGSENPLVPGHEGPIQHGVGVRLAPSGFEPVAFTLSPELFDVFLAARVVATGSRIIEGARRPTF